MTEWVASVRAAVPSPRPQAWQALQQSVGLAESGLDVSLVADAARPDGGPRDPAAWLGRKLPVGLTVLTPRRLHRPPLAGLMFRRRLFGLRSRARVLWCRDPRVAASEAGRWRVVLHEWHVPPNPDDPRHRTAIAKVDVHVTPAAGIEADLRGLGIPADRLHLVPNACGLSRIRAERRVRGEGEGVTIMGLHRRNGPDVALQAWAADPGLPMLSIVGRDQGGLRTRRWRERCIGGVRFLGPRWGSRREDVLDASAVWLAPYPDDPVTRRYLCPLQIVDGLGSSLPLVVPDLPSIRVLTDGQPAVHRYRAHEPQDLSRAVRDALQDGRVHRPRVGWRERAETLRRIVG